MLVAQAEVQPSEIQDLAEHIGDIKKLAVGLDLKLHVRIELGGSTRPPQETVEKINELLQEVSVQLKLFD